MNESITIDVTVIEPSLKHATVFNAFDVLNAGEAILLNNDHDPKPLYYQLLGERGSCFSWSYLQNGPETWTIEIRKNTTGAQPETLGEIVSKDLRKAEVFKKLGMDFCCGGKKSLEDACTEKGLNVSDVRKALDGVSDTQTFSSSHDFNSWSLSFLADYIVNVHHAYVKENTPMLSELSLKIADHHGEKHPELIKIRNVIDEMLCELKVHMKKEETILFPYVKQIEISLENGNNMPRAFNSVQQPVAVMEHDHDIVAGLSKEIRTLTSNYTLPADACNSYALLYRKLEEFENDLHLHIHLENNILFPKAVEAEGRL